MQVQYSTPAEAIQARTRQVGHCIEWTGSINERGYGKLWDGGRFVRVHRWVFEDRFGTLSPGMQVDHVCGNRRCVNIDHLRTATNKQNIENLTRLRSDNTTSYRGVYLDKRRSRWYARAFHNGVAHFGGYFDTAEEANEAAIALRNRLFTHNDRDRIA